MYIKNTASKYTASAQARAEAEKKSKHGIVEIYNLIGLSVKISIYTDFSFHKSNKVPRRYQRKVCIYGIFYSQSLSDCISLSFRVALLFCSYIY